LKSTLLAALSALMTAALCGCNVVAPVAMVVQGPPTVPAVFELNPERPTVVFVDDRHNRLPKRSLRSDIATVTERTLLDGGMIAPGNMIDHRAAMRVAARETPDEPLSIVEVGRRIGAEVVIYIRFDDFTITRDRVTVYPLCNAEVMIFDTVTNEKLLPAGEGSFALRTSLPPKTSPLQSLSLSERSVVERELASGVGLRLARMFFEYERDRDLTN
jgi:hypothetical protein